jgi:hypothetical protein
MANLKYRGNTTTPTKPTSTTAKNAPLTNEEIDGNLRSLNDSKLENTGWTAGDIFYADATGNLVRLPIGSTNQTLSVVGGFPAWTTGAASTTDIQEFTTPGTSTWIKPSGAKLIHVLMIGGGGGGACGGVRRTDGLSTVVMTGGPGGGGGGRMEYWISASELGASESVIVGAGGVGGAGITAVPSSNASGSIDVANPGTDGGFSRFALRYAIGGRGGLRPVQAQNNEVVSPGNIGSGFSQVYAAYTTNSTFIMRVYAAGYGGSVEASGSSNVAVINVGGDGSNSPGGGGSGGGLHKNSYGSTGGATGGGAGRVFTITNNFSSPGGSGYGGSFYGNATGYTVETPLSRTVGGWGGGGSGGVGTENPGSAGNGGFPGGGGGGGGATVQGFTSGKGGNGGSGYVKITTFK